EGMAGNESFGEAYDLGATLPRFAYEPTGLLDAGFTVEKDRRRLNRGHTHCRIYVSHLPLPLLAGCAAAAVRSGQADRSSVFLEAGFSMPHRHHTGRDIV